MPKAPTALVTSETSSPLKAQLHYKTCSCGLVKNTGTKPTKPVEVAILKSHNK